MEDKDVIRVLAEFMGWRLINSRYGPKWLAPGAFSTTDSVKPPDYLTDYNAIAEVWRKLISDTLIPAIPIARSLMDSHRVPEAAAITILLKTPRDHAHALAKAILEAKKQDEPGDFKGENY